MTVKYFTRRSEWDEDWYDDERPLTPPLSVSDHEPKDTGLIDKHGNTIWRGPNPVGFHRPRKR